MDQHCCWRPTGGKRGGRKAAEAVKVIPMARANNVAIMLTQFGGFAGGPAQIRQELLAAPGLVPSQAEAAQNGHLKGLSAEQLSLLLQVSGLPCPP